MKKLILLFIYVSVLVNDVRCVMTEKQMEATVKMLRNVCQPKSKLTNEQIAGMHDGVFPDERDFMCYTECILKTAQLMKDGKIIYDRFYNQVAVLPATYSGPGLVSFENCKDAPKSSDKCEAAYEMYKCFYQDNPGNFFLP